MNYAESSAFCKTCQRQVRITSKRPNHIFHLLMFLLTGGLWLVMWILVSLCYDWRCTHCGLRVSGFSIGSFLLVVFLILCGVFILIGVLANV